MFGRPGNYTSSPADNTGQAKPRHEAQLLSSKGGLNCGQNTKPPLIMAKQAGNGENMTGAKRQPKPVNRHAKVADE